MFRRSIIIITLLLTFFGAWLKGFTWFIGQIPTQPLKVQRAVDAIVTLTGGQDRINYAINLLQQGHAKTLFISGVGEDVTLQRILEQSDYLNDQIHLDPTKQIILGYAAEDTRGNARESSLWLKQHQHETILLVTANYHLPRSMVEFKSELPDLTILEAPVISPNVKLSQWWKHPGSALLLMSEYHKFIAAYIRLLF